MLQAAVDLVSTNKIWEEHLRKETRNLKMTETFSIVDPRKMDILPEKPNRTVPTSKPDSATLLAASATIAALSSLKDTERLPAERFALPLTASMEIGFWLGKSQPRANPQFDHKARSSDVTGFAENFIVSNGHSPYLAK